MKGVLEKIKQLKKADLKQVKNTLDRLVHFDPKNFVNTEYGFVKIAGERLLESLDVADNEMIVYDRQIVNFFDVEMAEAFLVDPNNPVIFDTFLDHLISLCAAVDCIGGMEAYDLDTLLKILNESVTTYSVPTLLHTLRQTIHGEYRHECALQILNFIKERQDIVECTFEEVLVLTLMLDVVWNDLKSLPEEDQSFLFEHTFYASIALDVPVRGAITRALYITTSPIEYILLNGRFHASLKKNSEEVLAHDTMIPMRSIFSGFLQEADEVRNNRVAQNKFVDNLKITNAASVKEALSIFVSLESGGIVKKNLGGERTASDVYDDDLISLIKFFLQKEAWNNIIIYYTQKPTVSFKNFIFELRDNIDLKKDSAINRLSEFNAFLHANGVLKKDQDLIEFREQDSSFHWNEELLK